MEIYTSTTATFHVFFSLVYGVVAIANLVWIIHANLVEYDGGRYYNCVRCGRQKYIYTTVVFINKIGI